MYKVVRSIKTLIAHRSVLQSLFLPVPAQSLWPTMRRSFVVGLSILVYCTSITSGALAKSGQGQNPVEKIEAARPKSNAQRPSVTRVPLAELPVAVQEMRDAILAAVARGDFEELQTAIEWNELPPDFGLEADVDPITYWKANARGNGIEILAILGAILEHPPAKLPLGRDLENNLVYVWPALSEVPPEQLTPGEQVELYRMAGAEQAEAIIESGKWTWYRLAIGADGTWHTFARHETK